MFEIFLALVVVVLVSYQGYSSYYFGSTNFLAIKDSIRQLTNDCNDLNNHIEDLKSTYAYVRAPDYGQSYLRDDSRYNMTRKKWQEADRSDRTHNCTASVVKNANNQPFKYLCKYFDIKTNEDTLSRFEEVLNNFSAAEQGKYLLKNQQDQILSSIDKKIPAIISFFSAKRVARELGFDGIDLSNLYFPVYTFRYVSAGGNSSAKCDIKLDVENLDRFVSYLNNLVKFRASIAGQRALMTSALREKIKRRDNFACKFCSLSAAAVQNLLLEIDHIIPLSKGGITSEDNLQTLCWKCNRTKGAKILNDS